MKTAHCVVRPPPPPLASPERGGWGVDILIRLAEATRAVQNTAEGTIGL